MLTILSSLSGLHTKAHIMDSARNTSFVLRRADNIIKSAEDKRSYRGLELSNHMKIFLVSDPATDKSAAAMDVNIGN